MTLGKYAATIIACYAIVFGTFAGLVVWLAFEGRRLGAELAQLEARGIKRRSAPASESRSASKPEVNERS